MGALLFGPMNSPNIYDQHRGAPPRRYVWIFWLHKAVDIIFTCSCIFGVLEYLTVERMSLREYADEHFKKIKKNKWIPWLHPDSSDTGPFQNTPPHHVAHILKDNVLGNINTVILSAGF